MKELRTMVISVRVTPKEWKMIFEKAKKAHISISDIIRLELFYKEGGKP